MVHLLSPHITTSITYSLSDKRNWSARKKYLAARLSLDIWSGSTTGSSSRPENYTGNHINKATQGVRHSAAPACPRIEWKWCQRTQKIAKIVSMVYDLPYTLVHLSTKKERVSLTPKSSHPIQTGPVLFVMNLFVWHSGNAFVQASWKHVCNNWQLAQIWALAYSSCRYSTKILTWSLVA
jgi:hypothetical protein